MNSLVAKIKSSRRASALTVAAAILVVALAAWFGVISPKRSSASSLKSQITDAQSQLIAAQAAAVKTNKEVAAAVLEAMPGTIDQPGILDQLNRIAKNAGVTLVTVTPTLSAVTTNAMALNISVKGNFFQIESFLKKARMQVTVGKGGLVHATGRLYDVSTVNISHVAGDQLTAAVTITASVYVPAAVTAPAATTVTATGVGSTG